MSDQLPALAVRRLRISDLTPDPANARRHSKRNIEAIANSLRLFGQRKPIVVQKAGMVVRAGNATLEDARDLSPHDAKYWMGPIGWILRNHQRLATPIHCLGRLGLWKPDSA